MAVHFLLLLWGGLLCLSVYLRAEQLSPGVVSHRSGSSPEQLSAEEQATPVAWSAGSAPQRATNPVDPVLPGLVPFCYLLTQQLTQLNLKPTKAILGGFSTLTEQFRILPNAP